MDTVMLHAPVVTARYVLAIRTELMDKDIRAALFDGFDEEGEFEELQDDFISQVVYML
jgi:hypothetical protein